VFFFSSFLILCLALPCPFFSAPIKPTSACLYAYGHYTILYKPSQSASSLPLCIPTPTAQTICASSRSILSLCPPPSSVFYPICVFIINQASSTYPAPPRPVTRPLKIPPSSPGLTHLVFTPVQLRQTFVGSGSTSPPSRTPLIQLVVVVAHHPRLQDCLRHAT